MRLFLLFIALFITNLSYAQQNVSGTVKDDTGETIPGATILELNSSNGVVTDIDGNFTISVSGSEAVLRISFLGYETQEITVGARSVIDVTLATDLQELEEVVVVGYGTVRKLVSVFPSVPFLFCVLLLFFYEIDKKMESKIEIDLKSKR